MTGLARGELESAGEMARALRASEVTSVQLVERAIARAEAWQPRINAFSQLWSDEALEVARAIDGRPPAERPSPLAGVPIAIKDLFDVAGHETTGCCAAYRGTIARRDGPVIERVRRVGLVMIGKTNQHELAAGGTNLVSACGRTGNPWDPDRMTGGSSGGSGAAVAAGIVPWALGSDTGGSIRIPASMCGIYGLKPTTGRLELSGMMRLAPSMDCPGPLAATIEDLGTLHDLMSSGRPPRATASGTGRIGVLERFFIHALKDEVADAVLFAMRKLQDSGIAFEGRDGGGIEDAREVWMEVCTPEFAAAHPLLKDPGRRRLVSPQPRAWIEQGERLPEEERAEARRRREQIRGWFLSRLEGVDALLIPTTPYAAPRATDKKVELGRPGRVVETSEVGPGFITCPVNLAGLPALNLPAGRSSQGMPIGVSLVGRPDGEQALLQLAARWERESAYRPRYPDAPPP